MFSVLSSTTSCCTYITPVIKLYQTHNLVPYYLCVLHRYMVLTQPYFLVYKYSIVTGDFGFADYSNSNHVFSLILN